jgi:hypothetical protein
MKIIYLILYDTSILTLHYMESERPSLCLSASLRKNFGLYCQEHDCIDDSLRNSKRDHGCKGGCAILFRD